jgi:hypothetical protein
MKEVSVATFIDSVPARYVSPLRALLITVVLFACEPKDNSLRTSAPTPDRPTPVDTTPREVHFKLQVAYERGTFRGVRLYRSLNTVRQRRSGPSANAIQWVARNGDQTLHSDQIPDVRVSNVETADPRTGQWQRHPGELPQPTYFLIDVPMGTERIDFYAPRNDADPAHRTYGGAPPIGSIELRDVAQVAQ